ncbi:hypothetical protein GE09DRAFT_619981 [Coniochaeta sp. 2T2.1]|nr:hypothetical protein GE09DRAFT_619981 [Coniochaeta sp. 2T2.1]
MSTLAMQRPIQDKEGNASPRRASGSRSKTKLFHCSQCSATFNRPAHLRRHEAAHQGAKPYSCRYCPVTSSRKDVIVRHTRNLHSESTSQEGRGNSPTAGHAEHQENGRRSVSPSAFVNLNPQATSPTAAERYVVPEQADGDLSSNGPSQPSGSPTNIQNAGSQATKVVSMDQQMFPTDFSFLDGTLQADEEMLGFMSSHQPGDMLWHLFGQGVHPSNTTEQNIELSPTIPQPQNFLSPGRSDTQQPDSPLLSNDEAYSEVLANMAKFDRSQRLSDFQFPSKFAMTRFVRAFFDHMAPHFPIIHRPSFNILTTPCPVLLGIMACGAMYSSEHETAATMHIAALRLMYEPEEGLIADPEEDAFQLWKLQASLLLSYFGAYNKSSQVRQRALDTFPVTANLAQDAIEAINASEATTYSDWVYQESVVRCIAGTGILGAVLNSRSPNQSFSVLGLEARFRLPSSNFDWTTEEQIWQGPPHVLFSDDVLRQLSCAQKPDLPPDDFAFLTVLSLMLGHICSFERLTSSHCSELYATFVEKTSEPVQVLDAMWTEQARSKESNCALPSPMGHLTGSVLDSIFYHLYAADQVKSMKRLLSSPSLLASPNEVQKIAGLPHPKSLGKALGRAVTALRFECRQGLNYIQKVAPHRYGPLSTTALTEGSLLLHWYFRYGRSPTLAPIQYPDLDAGMTEVTAEVQRLRMPTTTSLPLVVAATLLQESSVWQWPSVECTRLRILIKRNELNRQQIEGVY